MKIITNIIHIHNQEDLFCFTHFAPMHFSPSSQLESELHSGGGVVLEVVCEIVQRVLSKRQEEVHESEPPV